MKRHLNSIVRGGKPALSACRPAEKFRQHYQKGTTYSGGYGGGQTTYEGYRRATNPFRFHRHEREHRLVYGRCADITTHPFIVKNYGRATLSTVASGVPRPRIPSDVECMRITTRCWAWNDFPHPSFTFIDDASLLHGTSSVNETRAAAGCLVRLSTSPANHEGSGCSTCRE